MSSWEFFHSAESKKGRGGVRGKGNERKLILSGSWHEKKQKREPGHDLAIANETGTLYGGGATVSPSRSFHFLNQRRSSIDSYMSLNN